MPHSPDNGRRALRRLLGCVALILGLLAGLASRADTFLDLTSVTPGGPGTGSFSGTLGGATVTGSIAPGVPTFFFNAPGPGISNSTIDASSPQFSYSTVFSPTASFADRVGFTYTAAATILVSMTLSSPVTDPVFHFANLDWAGLSFAPTTGLTSLTLLKGNDGPDSDGIDPAFGGVAYSFLYVHDLTPSTTDSTLPSGAPPTSGSRSAYASVRLNGTFSTIGFAVDALGPFSDNGSFTMSVVPEPGTMALAGLGALALAVFNRRRISTQLRRRGAGNI